MGMPFVKYFDYHGDSSSASKTVTLGYAPSALIVTAKGATCNSWIWTAGDTTTVWNVGSGVPGTTIGTATTATVAAVITTATLGFVLPANSGMVNGANIHYYGVAFSNNQ